jgi:uncharacterized membrane protein
MFRFVIGLIVLAVVVQSIHYYPLLPPVMASHFGGNGEPNGWSSRESFFLLYYGIGLTTFIVFVFMPSLLKRVPASMINLPNREYWLSEENKPRAIRMIEDQMRWVAAATLGLMVIIVQIAILANLGAAARTTTRAFWLALGAYGVFMAIWLVGFRRRFSRRDVLRGALH